MKLHVILLLFLFQNIVNCSKILIISQQPYLSNQKIAAGLAEDLAKHGHEVTIFTSYYFGHYHQNVDEFNFDTQTLSKVPRNSHKSWLQIYHETTDLHHKVSLQQMKHPEIRRIMTNQRKFDLLIIDCVICQLLAIAEVQNISAIYLSPTEPFNFVNDHFGNEVNPSIHPETHAISYKHGRLSLAQRFNSYFSFHYWKFLGGLHHCVIMRRSLNAEFPNLKFTCHQLYERLEFLFIFTNPGFGNVRPLVPKTIQCGFIYVDQAVEIRDKTLNKFLDASREGVIVFNVEGLKFNEMQVFLNVFKKLDHSIVLNVENSTNFVGDKIYSTRNAQLSDIIAHPSVKLVITTADYREIEVLLKRHMPMMLVPLTHEQIVNSELMFDRKVAKIIDVNKMTENDVLKSINDMMNNLKFYQERAEKLERFVSDRPKLREMPVWYTEYVIRHNGAKHLDYAGRNVPYYQKLFLDIYLFFGFVFYIVLRLLLKAKHKIRRVYVYVCGLESVKGFTEKLKALVGKRKAKKKQ